MNDKELGESLLRWDARGQTPGVEAHEQVADVLRRDHRRVRWLAFGTIVFWVLTAVGVPLCYYLYLGIVFPKVNQLMEEVITHKDGAKPEELVAEVRTVTQITLKMGVALVTATADALLLAAACTVWLVFAARRATLRQVNANLAEVAEQLKRLRPPGATP